MASRPVKFTNPDGEELAGLIDLPAGDVRAFALFAHCFTCTKNLKAATNISRALNDAGFATLRFDFTGLGQSSGDFADTTFSSNVGDLVAAAEFLSAEYEAPQLLVGHSLGGTAVLQAAADIPSAKAVATIGSPARPSHVRHLLAGSEDALEQDGEADVDLGGRRFRIRKEFVDDLQRHALPESIRRLGKALMIFHSPQDDTVAIDNAAELYQHALHPKSFVSLDRADHLLSNAADSRYVGSVLASWAERYLDETHAASGDADLPEEGFVRARTPIGGFRTVIDAGPHRLIGDEPTSIPGGTDTGPTPYGFLSAALAACTSMTLKMYATHKKLPIEEVFVDVRHSKIHAADCEHCETTDGRIDRFETIVDYDGDLTPEQAQRFLEIAAKCPVHRTLKGEIDIVKQLADAANRLDGTTGQ
ncbi:MAG: bifunctional alpha/beta hydrolase/OsmC family protein [Pseudomonadota bacterium]